MVIHQFNKLIRNKWVWGCFAVVVSAAFCFDDWFTSRGNAGDEPSGNAGTLAGEPVDAKTYQEIVEEVRGFGRNRDWKRNPGEVNRAAWENYATMAVAARNGAEATPEEVREIIARDPSFQQGGSFNFSRYQAILRENSLSPARYEQFVGRGLSMGRVTRSVLGSAAWVSPMELDRAVADMTDAFTVKVASFTQDPKASAAIKIDDAGLRKWYDDNTNSLALPERVKIRYVRYDATKTNVLAKMTVTEDEMRDRYDVTVDKYTTTDTNGVETVKKFEEVKAGIEKELRQIAAVQYFETNLNQRAYAVAAKKGSSRLDEIAKEDGAKVETSSWFSTEGGYQEGFMVYPNQVAPGARGLAEAVAELDPTSEDLRYAVISSDRAVWLIEKAEVSPRHLPTFDEAKTAIRARALRDARAEAFKKEVEAVAKGGVKAVLASKSVSTNITFSVGELSGAAFENAGAVARAASKLVKGEISEFTLTGTGKAILVVCEDRQSGDAAKAIVMRSQIRDELAMLQQRQVPERWKGWNLDRLGFEPSEISSVEQVETED